MEKDRVVKSESCEFKSGDRVVFYVDVGRMPSNKAKQYLRDITNQLREDDFIPKDCKLLVTAASNRMEVFRNVD